MAKKSNFSDTSSQDSNTFNKGMVKDLSDVYMSEGMWSNAVNAINNSHNGESGAIGNEMSNKYCSEAPYTIIGTAHKKNKEWVIFSTDDVNSEIGIFDEATCTYVTVINDQCLNFNKLNLITGAVKENYDCTWSVFWQDNRNPDRRLNLDRIPYICSRILVETSIPAFSYTIERDDKDIPTQSLGGFVNYTDINGNSVIIEVALGDSEVICALENTIVYTNTFHITEVQGASCGDFISTGTNPEDCGVEICTDDLDCDAIRLHPLVTQPCLEIQRAQGSGQLNNGSYIATIAYSENGLKLTDYATPSVPVALWDHTGIGGGVEVRLSNLDEDYDEYELVIVSVINQQTIAKKIGYYSTDQTTVTLDIINASLETVDLGTIPLKNAVYEKSEKMSVVNDYLIRSAVTTQPFTNYQPLANQIVANWKAVRYPYTYYRDGGVNVGNMRDEVYPYFIRWVYKTGNVTHSYHIPGRAALPSDLAIVTGDNVVAGRNQTWQVYDTSDASIITINPTQQPVDKEFKGYLKGSGRMAYWESTERYPNEHPEIWGDLCGKPIRHHKMPSNETIHIHEGNGEFINVLGVEFSNVQHPVDENGVPIEDFIGYEILRGSREGNRSIVAKGMFNNMRSFPYDDDGAGSVSSIKYGLYQNYPYNDLRKDGFLTRNPAFVEDGDPEKIASSADNDAYALTDYRQNYFSFHSPETTFIKPYLGSGSYVRVYTEERANVKGNFREPHKHPKHTIITDVTFVAALLAGFGVGLVEALGKNTTSSSYGASFFGLVSADVSTGRGSGKTGAGNIADVLTVGGTNAVGIPGLIGGIVGFVLNLGYFVGQATDVIMDIWRSMLKDRQYALQFNSHGFYDTFTPLVNAYTRGVADQGIKYIGRGVQKFNSTFDINNLNRNKYVCIHLDNSSLPDPTSSVDNTRQRLIDLANDNVYGRKELYENPTHYGVRTESVAYYGAIKFDFDNQYGQLRSIVQLPVQSCITESILNTSGGYDVPSSGILFGGDTYINRYTEKNPYMFFNTWMFDLPDGDEYDYRNYINGPLPRYWVNYEKFDMDDFSVELGASGDPDPPLAEYGGDPTDTDNIQDSDADESEGKMKDIFNNIKDGVDNLFITPSDFHRLDRPESKRGIFAVKNSYFYLFYNGIRDFFCESELNMAHRDYGESDDDKFYDVYNHSFDDQDYIFRSDKITNPIFLKYDLSLSVSKLFNNFASWSQILPRDYDPVLYSTCFEYYPKRSVYSLQQQEGLKRDNWRNYLALNYRDFPGKVSTIKPLNRVGAAVLFEDAEPLLFTGTDTIQTAGGTQLTVGTSNLFSDANLKAMVNADDPLFYATCISSRSAINTPHGLFYISQDSGKILQYSQNVTEISKNGMKHWFAENLPSFIRESNPAYELYDNPVAGTGCQAIYDPTYELVYFMKRDYIAKVDNLLYDSPTGIPYLNCGIPEVEPTAPPTATQPIDCDGTCPEGYELVEGVCTREVAGEATLVGGTPINVQKGITSAEYAKYGAILFPDITSLSGSGLHVGLDPSANNHKLYENGLLINPEIVPLVNGIVSSTWGDDDANKGRLNAAGLNVGTQGGEVCFSVCIDVPETKQYIIGLAADNECDFSLDGDLIADINGSWTSGSYTQRPFRKWYLLPITLTAGSHIIKMCGRNAAGTISAFGAEIYDITLDELMAHSTLLTAGSVPSELTPYLFWSTLDVIGTQANNPVDPGQWFCGDVPLEGDPCSNTPSCIVTETIEVDQCAECSLIADETLINENGSVLLTWSTENGVTVNTNFGVSGEAPEDLNGSILVSPTENTTYWIEVTAATGLTTVCLVDITLKCDCAYDDLDCFEPAHWTVSYDPKNKMWISFHDWSPTLCLPSNQHFNTIDSNTIWKHNDDYNSYANYYGIDYAWEIEYPLITPPAITTLRNIEYVMEVLEFTADGRDNYHVLDDNFDRAIVYNSEQISGLLKLNLKGKNSPSANLGFPYKGSEFVPPSLPNAYEILYAKEENKYRFNQFWDITSNRGEFNQLTEPMFNTQSNGMHKNLNQLYIDYDKPFTQRKKFRHYGNRVILRKTISGSKKMILRLVNTKHLLSSV